MSGAIWRRAAGALGAVFALVGIGTQAADAQSVDARAAPPAWIAYARNVSTRLQAALAGDGEAAQRFGAFFDNWADWRNAAASEAGPAAASGARPPDGLRLSVWIDGTGRVARVDVDPGQIPDAQAAADLRSLLQGQPVGLPPRNLKQPVVIRLTPGAAV